jgi:hypothetical protein
LQKIFHISANRDKEQRTRSKEQGIMKREQEIGIEEEGAKSKEQGTKSSEQLNIQVRLILQTFIPDPGQKSGK